MNTEETTQTFEPLPPAIEALVAPARVVLDKPEIVRARLLARARESLQRGDIVALKPRRMGIFRLFFAAAAGVALVASVAAAYQVLRRPTPPSNGGMLRPAQPESIAPVLPKPTPGLPLTPSLPATPDNPAPAVLVPQTSTAAHRSNPSRRDRSGIEELRFLERARQSAAHGDYASVLVIAAEHERSFPAGQLAEEREFLRVKALLGLDRADDVRRVAAKFRRQFPRSVLLQTIEDMSATLR
jgi:hypothetical protein